MRLQWFFLDVLPDNWEATTEQKSAVIRASVLARVSSNKVNPLLQIREDTGKLKKSMFPFITVLLKPLAFKWPCSWKTHIWEAEGVKLSRTRDWDLEQET